MAALYLGSSGATLIQWSYLAESVDQLQALTDDVTTFGNNKKAMV